VAPAQQGSGHAKRLLAFAEQQARAAGMGEIRLYTNARMTRNIALYAACGYRETGRRSNPARPGWTVVDMAKPLTPASCPPGAAPSAGPPQAAP
jgi:ribosomal protein S18 acetylase RimI-like enzyme